MANGTKSETTIRYHSSADAWSGFPDRVIKLATEAEGLKIGELGGGANPLLSPAQVADLGLDYTLIDIAESELAKAPAAYHKVCADVAARDFSVSERFDFVFSRMLAEHVRDAALFHRNVFQMLRPGGRALHFFPTLFSPPFIANYLMPHQLAYAILRSLQPIRQAAGKHAKFPAYYHWCYGPTSGQMRRFASVGFEVEEYQGYFGHSRGWTVGPGYYDRIPPLLYLHDRACRFLMRTPLPQLTCYAQVLLRRPAEAAVGPQGQKRTDLTRRGGHSDKKRRQTEPDGSWKTVECASADRYHGIRDGSREPSGKYWFETLSVIQVFVAMRLSRIIVATAVSWLAATPVHAELATVIQRPSGAGSELVLGNQSDTAGQPLTITAMVVGIDQAGGVPATTNLGWIAQTLDAAAWDLPMGGAGADRYTWRQFTGRAFDEVFAPVDPCYGFFVDYGRENDLYIYGRPVDPCLPGAVLGGFFFDGLAVTTTFLVAGINDPSAFAGPVDLSNPPPDLSAMLGIDTSVGTVQAVPEPSTFGLAGLGAVGWLARLWRRGKNPEGASDSSN